MMEVLTYDGLILGASAVGLIALSRWLCIKGEYYFTKRIWWFFLLVGCGAVLLSVFAVDRLLSAILSVMGFCFLWGIGEVIQQEQRVKRGWFPMNPRRQCGRVPSSEGSNNGGD